MDAYMLAPAVHLGDELVISWTKNGRDSIIPETSVVRGSYKYVASGDQIVRKWSIQTSRLSARSLLLDACTLTRKHVEQRRRDQPAVPEGLRGVENSTPNHVIQHEENCDEPAVVHTP